MVESALPVVPLPPESSVVLIEDDADTEFLVRRAFTRLGVPTLTVLRDGEEAIQWARDAQAAPRMVLLDVKLPKADGFQVLREIRGRKRFQGVPVVMFSTDESAEAVAESAEGGATAFERKPIGYDSLRQTLSRMLERYPAAAAA